MFSTGSFQRAASSITGTDLQIPCLTCYMCTPDAMLCWRGMPCPAAQSCLIGKKESGSAAELSEEVQVVEPASWLGDCENLS